MHPQTSTIVFDSTSDGLVQLRRHWSADDPRAALLLVHGIGEHSGRYEHVGRAFADAGIDTLSFDARGFGGTGGRPAYVETFDEYVDDVAALMRERRSLGVPVVLMGHSLGGLVVTTYLVGDREQPDLAVLSAPALGAEVPRWQRVAIPLLSRLVPRLHVKSDFDGSILSRDEAVQEAYDRDPLRVNGSTAALGRHILATMRSTNALLHRIEVPTYVLHGSADELVLPATSEPLGRLANVQRRLWPGLRHECLNEPEREQVIGEIVEWIDLQLAAAP